LKKIAKLWGFSSQPPVDLRQLGLCPHTSAVLSTPTCYC